MSFLEHIAYNLADYVRAVAASCERIHVALLAVIRRNIVTHIGDEVKPVSIYWYYVGDLYHSVAYGGNNLGTVSHCFCSCVLACVSVF